MRSLLEEPEVAVTGAAQGAAGSIIHRMFVSAQRVGAGLRACKRKEGAKRLSFGSKSRSLVFIAKHQSNIGERFEKYKKMET